MSSDKSETGRHYFKPGEHCNHWPGQTRCGWCGLGLRDAGVALSDRWSAVDGVNWAGATRGDMIDVVIGALEDQARGDDQWVSGSDLEVRIGAIALAWSRERKA